MKIAVCVRRAVVVDDDIHTLDINTTPEDISRNEYTLLERLERGVAVDTTCNVSLARPILRYDRALTAPPVRGQSEC